MAADRGVFLILFNLLENKENDRFQWLKIAMFLKNISYFSGSW